jgi:hypothetical protein
MNDEFDQDPAGKQQESAPEQGRETVYFYKDAGIQEHHGYIPFWLKAVALILVIWSVYYMIAYWSPPPE